MLPIVIIVFLQQIKRTFFKLIPTFCRTTLLAVSHICAYNPIKNRVISGNSIILKISLLCLQQGQQKKVENSFAQTPVCKNKCFVELLSSFKTNCKSKTSPPLLRSPIPRRQTQSYCKSFLSSCLNNGKRAYNKNLCVLKRAQF